MDAAPPAESLRHVTHLEWAGVDWRQRGERLRGGDLVRVRRGWYADAAIWRSWWSEGRHLARVHAAQRAMRGSGGVFSHQSAAVLWGLPLYGGDPPTVHTTLRRGAHVRSTAPVQRHRTPLDEADIVEREGIACTSLSRTVLDAARTTRPETAIALADAAFRLVAWSERERRYDLAADEVFRAGLRARIEQMPGARGIRQTRWIVDHADGRAQLPGESVSRLQLLRLGFRRIRLQVPVPGPHGRDYAVDFGLDEVAAWGEFDGRSKYLDPAMAGDRDPLEVLAAEKEREDWIRATTGRLMARWDMPHIGTPALLSRRLAVYGIRPPRHVPGRESAP